MLTLSYQTQNFAVYFGRSDTSSGLNVYTVTAKDQSSSNYFHTVNSYYDLAGNGWKEFPDKQSAIDFANSMESGFSGPIDKPNLANTKSSGGTTRESNPPKFRSDAVNSSISHQRSGPSLPKASQGVIANTIISINNSIPAHGCDIKLPVLFQGIQTKFKKFIETETKNLQNFATWLSTDVISPIVEAIKNAVKAVKDRIKQIQKYIDKIKKIVEDIKEFIQEVQEVIAFIMSLPAKLMQLVANCLSALQSGLTTMVQSAVDAGTASSSATTNAATKTNATPKS